MREFRFGFNTNGLRPSRELADLCRTGEQLGYDTVLGTDHLATGSPFLPLAVAAASTERLRVGTLTLNNEFWNPAMLAREAVTLDWLTEGRLELGLGSGHMKWEFDAADLPWRPANERVERLGVTIEHLRRLFAEGPAEPESAAHERQASGRPQLRPVQRHGFGGSGPPLLVGGTGDRVLTLAAQHADIINYAGIYQIKGEPPGTFRIGTADEADERVAFVRGIAGDRFDDIEASVLVQVVSITNDRRSVAEQLVSTQLVGYTVDEVLETPFVLIGTVEQIAEQLRANRERFGFSYITVHGSYMRDLGLVIEKLRT